MTDNPAGAAADVLAARVEEAAMNAWPALGHVLHDGWLLRLTHGFTRRANSVNVLGAGQRPLAEKVAFCEQVFGQAAVPCVFRLTSLAPEPGLDGWLDAHGYRRVDETLVMLVDAASFAHSPLPLALARPAWLAVYARLADSPAEVSRLHELILGSILLPTLHGAWPASAGSEVAVGLAVHEVELVGLFDIVTAPAQRRQGHARALVAGLIGWGARHGATHGYLQVVGANEPAIRLYESLGFARLYSYWYRLRP